MTKKQHHGFLIWKAPGKVPAVRIGHDVIDRMTVDIMRGFGVTRRRGTEVGGVLLGKISGGEEPLVLVYDYETVPCEYSQGPSYVLSERDLQGFRHAVSQWAKETSPDQHVVGYFRSHTREGLYLDETDAKVFHQHLKDPLAVALVIKPFATRASEAAFFLQSAGRLESEPSLPEFQFVRSESAVPNEPPRFPLRSSLVPTRAEQPEQDTTISSVEPAAEETPVPASSFNTVDPVPLDPVFSAPVATTLPPPPQPIARQERPEPVVERERPRPLPERTPVELPVAPSVEPVRVRPAPEVPSAPMFGTYYPAPLHPWRSRLLWMAYTIAVFGFGAVAGFEYAGGEPKRLRLGALSTGASVRPVDPYSVQLSAVEQEQSVLVRWDRDSEAIRTALYGVLSITEGAGSKQVKLDFPELRNGTVLYHKMGQQVSFRLDLYFKENRVLTESVTLRFPGK